MKTRTSIYYRTLVFAYMTLMAVLFTGCHEVNTPKKNTDFIVKNYYSPLVIVKLDSCEYLFGEWGDATVLTHKGNCKYCTERNKNNYH